MAEDELRRVRQDADWPLHLYARAELARSFECFFGADPRYHEARRRFVFRLAPAPPTPVGSHKRAHDGDRAGKAA